MAKRTGGFIGQDGINAPDPATGVTGTAGDGQVTVSWTAPSDVGGAAITGYNVQSDDGSGTWKIYYDMANTSYDNVSFSTSTQSTTPTALAFNSDGTKMYVGDYSNKVFYQYSLSSAFDVSSASYDSVSFSVTSQVTFLADVTFNNDGTKMYVVGDGNDTVFQYSLSSGFDLSSASYDSVSFDVSSQATSPQGISFNSDGTKMYIVCYNNNAVYQYSLSSSFDLSSASYDSISFSVSSQVSQAQGLAFSSDGLKMFVGGNATDTIFEYDLSSAYAISGASYSGNSFSVATQETNPSSFAFNNDGSKLFVVGYTNDAVFQYTAGDFSYPTASPVTVSGLTNGTSYTFNVWAINPFGWSSPSDASGSVSPALQRGLFGGGNSGNVIDYISIPSTGNATDFGDLTTTRDQVAGLASATRGVFGMGNDASDSIDYVTIASTGNASDFGDPTINRTAASGLSNSTRGVFVAGAQGGSFYNNMDYITIASTGNATDYGDYFNPIQSTASCASSTRGISSGGLNSNYQRTNSIRYITIASTGNTTDFGDLTGDRYLHAMFSSSTRGVSGGGNQGGSEVNIIDYITIASTGNAADFGDLSQSLQQIAGLSSELRGVFGGGRLGNGSATNEMQYITIASTGNTTDFGDRTVSTISLAGCSNCHGGLS